MTYPTKYARQFDFQSYQNANPTRPLPGDKVNIDLNAVVGSVGEVIEFQKLVQRSDGTLANASVGYDQLAPALQANGLAPAEPWETGRDYVEGTAVFESGKLYRCLVPHISSAFATDFGAGKWSLIADFVAGIALGLGYEDESTDNALVRFDGVQGGTQNSGVTLSDADVLSGAKVISVGSTIARSLEARFADEINVLDFGAVGDGVTDDAAAINAALAHSKNVVLAAGKTFSIGSTLSLPSGTTFKGAPGAKIKVADGANVTAVKPATDATFVSLIDLEIDGNKANNADGHGVSSNGTTGLLIRGCHIHDCYASGVLLAGTANSGVRIEGNYVHDCDLSGLGAVTAIDNFTISGNIVRRTGTANIGVGIATYGTISHNACEDAGLEEPGADNISFYEKANHHITVNGNSCRRSGNHCIHGGGSHVTYAGNVVTGADFNGIYHVSSQTERSAHVSIVGNSANDNGRDGISVEFCDGVTITGNASNDNASGCGVITGDVTRIAISGNSCNGNIHGVRLSTNTARATVVANTCEGNTQHGIFNFDGDDCTITLNALNNNGQFGLVVGSGSTNTIIGGNKLLNNTSGASSLSGTFTRLYESGGTDVAITDGGTGQSTAYAGRDALSVHGADIAAATTLNLDAATGYLIDITGNTQIDAVTLADGRERWCRFTGTPQLTNGASLVVPGGTRAMAAGDYVRFMGYAAGVVRAIVFPANGKATIPSAFSDITSKPTTLAGYGITDQVERVIAASGLAGSSHTGTLTETTLLTIPIPADSLGANGYIDVDIVFDITNNAVASEVLRAKYGGTTFMQFSNTTGGTDRLSVRIQNRNATNSQVSSGANPAGGTFGTASGSAMTGAIDSTAAQNLTVTAQLGDVTDALKIVRYVVKTCKVP